MNKYQEALKWFQSIHDVLGQEQYYEDLGMRFGQGLYESLQAVKELVDKETPMKPNGLRCGKCGSWVAEDTYTGIVHYPRCRKVGCEQTIDWSRDSE